MPVVVNWNVIAPFFRVSSPLSRCLPKTGPEHDKCPQLKRFLDDWNLSKPSFRQLAHPLQGAATLKRMKISRKDSGEQVLAESVQ